MQSPLKQINLIHATGQGEPHINVLHATSYLRLVDFCITHLYAEGNKEEEEEDATSIRETCSDWSPVIDSGLVGSTDSLGGVPREQKILKGHLPRVRYHQVY